MEVKENNENKPQSPIPISKGIEYIEFPLGKYFFPIYFGDDKIEELIQILLKHPNTQEFDKLMIGLDKNTEELCWPLVKPILDKYEIKYSTCIIPPGEENKSYESLGLIYDCFFKEMCGTRKTIIVACGGGIVSNIFGLAASTIFRGIRLIQMPTSFLNAHDAGGSSQKQAINYAGRKNVIGTFHMPVLVLTDSKFYCTLPEKEIKSGFGELTKNAIAFGGEDLELIEETTMNYNALELKENYDIMKKATKLGKIINLFILLGILAKANLLKNDEKEKKKAIVFEFGHTIGHGYELALENTSHGECVTMGCDAASYVSYKMNFLEEEEFEKIQKIAEALKPEMKMPDATEDELVEKVFNLVKNDNKRGYLPEKKGRTPMILIAGVGDLHEPNQHFLDYVPDKLVKKAIRYGIKKYAKKM